MTNKDNTTMPDLEKAPLLDNCPPYQPESAVCSHCACPAHPQRQRRGLSRCAALLLFLITVGGLSFVMLAAHPSFARHARHVCHHWSQEASRVFGDFYPPVKEGDRPDVMADPIPPPPFFGLFPAGGFPPPPPPPPPGHHHHHHHHHDHHHDEDHHHHDEDHHHHHEDKDHHHHEKADNLDKTMEFATGLTDLESMPLAVASLYYRSLKTDSDNLNMLQSAKIEKNQDQKDNDDNIEATRQAVPMNVELARERGKVLKRIFHILQQEKKDQEWSANELIDLIGMPDMMMVADANSQAQIIPGMMGPGPFISNEFKPDQSKEGSLMVDFIYYGESAEQGMSVKVSEEASQIAKTSSSENVKNKIVSCNWFDTTK